MQVNDRRKCRHFSARFVRFLRSFCNFTLCAGILKFYFGEVITKQGVFMSTAMLAMNPKKSKEQKQEKTDLDIIIGKNIEKEREARNLTQHQLAELLGCCASTAGSIERGTRGATAVRLAQLSRVFQTPIDNFYASVPLFSVKEEREGKNPIRKRIDSMLANFSDAELEAVVQMLQAIGKMSAKK
jgi:transcriptional regulator with XRE-family HTH domain